MPAEMNLAEIIAEVRRQNANFQTVILKTGHALRLVALVEAAVEMRGTLEEYMENDDHFYENCEELPYGADDCPLCQSERALAAFDALASPATGAGEEGK